MAKVKKKEIVAYDPLGKKLYKLADNLLSEIDGKCNPQYCVGFVPANLVKYAAIGITDDAEVSEAVGNKAYEELGLDIEIDYQIRYALAASRSNDSGDIYNVLSVESGAINELYKDVVSKLNYVDYIDYEPMQYTTYYTSGIFEGQGLDIYLYLHKSYSTLTIYKDSELCAFKLLNKLSIDSIHAAYCHELAERIPEHVFIDELNRYGFDHIDDTKRVALNKVLADASPLLINNISFILRQLRMENEAVSTVIIGSDLGLNSNLLQKMKVVFAHFKNSDADMVLEYMLENNSDQSNDSLIVSNFVNIHKISYDLCKNLKNFMNENQQCTISPFVMMGFLRANEQIKENSDIFNVSTFLRPPPILKRSSGQLIAALIVTLIGSGIYPAVNFMNGYFASQDAADIIAQLPSKRDERTKIKSQIDGLNAQISNINSQIESERSRLNTRYALVNGLYDKKVNYLSKAKILTELTKAINKVHVFVDNFQVTENSIRVKLMGSNKAITDFVHELGSDNKYDLLSRELNINKQDDVYTSEIEIRIK